MKPLPISVVVPVSTDDKIKQCLESVDEKIEIIVVLNNNPSSKVVEIVNSDPRCKTIIVKEIGCNLAAIFNKGIDAASNEKVLLTNSDCLFPPGLIAKMCRVLDDYEISKARVVFTYSNREQQLVAECRRLFHHVFDDGMKLFGPGLSFRKSIRINLGGYFFEEQISWGEDGELSDRIHKAGIKFYIVTDCLFHSEENILHDLLMAWRIGRGTRRRDKVNKISLFQSIKNNWHYSISDPKKRFRIAYFEGGYPLYIYLHIWKFLTYLGYYLGERR